MRTFLPHVLPQTPQDLVEKLKSERVGMNNPADQILCTSVQILTRRDETGNIWIIPLYSSSNNVTIISSASKCQTQRNISTKGPIDHSQYTIPVDNRLIDTPTRDLCGIHR